MNFDTKTTKQIVGLTPRQIGYWVGCPDIPGCASQGDTVEEALTMITDAIKRRLDALPKKRKAG